MDAEPDALAPPLPAPFPPRRTSLPGYPLLIAAGLVLFKLAYLAFPNLFPEEAYYWLYARHLDFGYLDHPPMVAWLIAAGTSLFGDTEFGIRIFALVCSVATSCFVYRLAALLYDRRTAAFAVLIAQVLPYYFLTGFIMTPDAPLSACWAGMLYWLACVFFERRAAAWIGVGVCLGVGMLSKYSVALLGPATLLFLALDPPSRTWFRRPAPYLAVALAALIFSPVIRWNQLHHWASFAFQTTGRTRASRHFSLHELLGAVVAVLTPAGIWLCATGLAKVQDPGVSDASPAPQRRRSFALVYTLVPLAVFVVFSLRHHVKLNWTGPLWLAAIPAMAARLAALTENTETKVGARLLRYLWNATVVFCVTGYAVCLHHLAFGIPGVKFLRNIELLPVGWPELARAVAQQKRALEASVAGPVYVVGMDRNFVASELSFYGSNRPKALPETLGVNLFEGSSLMFGYWFSPARFEGATLLLVSLTKPDVDSQRVADHTTRQEEVQTHTIQHHGQPVRPYFTRVVSGYHAAPRPDAVYR